MVDKLKPLLVFLLILSCESHPTIEITREYIYNSYWGSESYNYPAVSISEISLNEEIIDKNPQELSGFKIHNNHTTKDFSFFTELNYDYKSNKIFFDKEYESIIWYKRNNLSVKTKKIGKLKIDSWYKFDSHLYKKWVYYVYVDKEGNIYNWAVNPVNI